MVLDWQINVDYLDKWWWIATDSPTSGILHPGEFERIYVEVNRAGKRPGEYWGTYTIRARGTGYQYEKRVYIIMEVGGSFESTTPQLININTNTGNNFQKVILVFDKGIDPLSVFEGTGFRISPFIKIHDIRVINEQVILTTAPHADSVSYTIQVDSIRDVKDRQSRNLAGEYRFYYCPAGPELDVAGSDRKYEWDVARSNKFIYTRNNFVTLGKLPADLEGSALLKTNEEDVLNDNLALSFTINGEAGSLFLAVDPRRNNSWHSTWLDSNFTKLSRTLPVNGIENINAFQLYESKVTYQAGDTVRLFENGAPGANALMYFALVKGLQPGILITGKVTYAGSIRSVPATVMTLGGAFSHQIHTNEYGDYQFTHLTENLNYTVKPFKAFESASRAIQMYDAALTSQFANGLFSHPTEWQKMAADVNRDQKITMEDAESIARYVVHLSNQSTAVGTWEFQPSVRTYTRLTARATHEDFTGILLGDVDASWTADSGVRLDSHPEPFQKQTFAFLKDGGQQNNQFIIPFHLDVDAPVYSFLITLEYDPATLKFLNFNQMMQSSYYLTFFNDDKSGHLTIGSFSTADSKMNEVAFDIHFEMLADARQTGDVQLIDCTVNGKRLLSEQRIFVRETAPPIKPTQMILYQNYPNPFNPATKIRFECTQPNPQPVSIQVFNLKGALIKTFFETIQGAGTHEIRWDGTDRYRQEVASGVYFVHLKFGNEILTQKIVKLK